ncbi:signal peptidase II [Psychrobacter sp. 72-O-c]|uniref:signal peptidase II n=1 Tax=Psychrobacter sp. 72-O-c TaxID=2774125 RepID=UPI0019187466|nr:signal peptidase II [Psychrobacter sp. 72-O-c]
MPNPSNSSDTPSPPDTPSLHRHDQLDDTDSANPQTSSPKPAHVTTGSSLTPKGRLVKTPKIVANGSRAFRWYLLALVVLIVDQWTKWLAETNLTFHEPVPVIEPFLNWTLAYNYGAAFSFLADAGGWQKWFFSGLALVMSLFLIVYLIKAPRQAKLLSTGLALVLGGAVGNLIDRLLHGHVIDFIHVHNADVWHYPIFNIADMGISIGVAMIIIDMLFLEKKRHS